MSLPTPSIWLRACIALLCAVLLCLLLFSWINHLEMAEKAKEANQTLVSLALGFLLPGWLSWPLSLGNTIGSWVTSALFFCARLIAFWLVVARLSWPLSGPIARWLSRWWKATKSSTNPDSPASTPLLQKLIPVSGGIFEKFTQGVSMPIHSFVPAVSPTSTEPSAPKEYSPMNVTSLAVRETVAPETSAPATPEPKMTKNQEIISSCFDIQSLLMGMDRQDSKAQQGNWLDIHGEIKKIVLACSGSGACHLDQPSKSVLELTISRLTAGGARGIEHAALLRQLLRQ